MLRINTIRLLPREKYDQNLQESTIWTEKLSRLSPFTGKKGNCFMWSLNLWQYMEVGILCTTDK